MDISVGFKNPAFGLNRDALLEHEHPMPVDYYVVRQTDDHGFGNPLYEESKESLVNNGDWSSNESMDAALLTENVEAASSGKRSLQRIFFLKKP